MKAQDKQAEAIVGSGTPEDEWLDDTNHPSYTYLRYG